MDMADDCCGSKQWELERLALRGDQRRVLQVVLAVNSLMFVAEFTAGLIAGSAALMADSVDMLGDAIVYAVSLYALNRSAQWKAGAALTKAVFILMFGIAVLVEVVLKLRSGAPPSSTLMLVMGCIALAANSWCLTLLWRFRTFDVNMSSTFECSRNDVIANVGVLTAAGLVAATGKPWPDLLVGMTIAALFLRSAARVFDKAIEELFRAAK